VPPPQVAIEHHYLVEQSLQVGNQIKQPVLAQLVLAQQLNPPQ
jgi:hypothetical protein